MASFVKTTREKTANGDVCTVAIDNQKKLNTLNSDILVELQATFDALKSDKDVAVVVLTGAGEKAFVGGANINEMAELNPDTARAFITSLHNVCAAIRALPVPVIARVNGYCLGAGMEIAAICDIVVAEATAEFAMPEVRVGIPSVIEAAILPRTLGVGLARDLVLTARTLYGDEAYQAGFVQRLAEKGKLDEATNVVVEEILEGGRNAIRLQKELCNMWENTTAEEGIQCGIDSYAKAFEVDEPRTMMTAFINRKR
ncbi:enoyl-CoA hydratase [Sneathiella chinensis]|uniref:Enoyl-CoA hydratase n=1 Tax=Sneathiella chinensis TaxID=349750 RepID=A0ABQ5U271_9PROT|nr:enoyl-CoA hydratase [Sneathiella chinensis]GLQ05358.1 enoyl-CoA hydratase [Sneathiella chinensis]